LNTGKEIETMKRLTPALQRAPTTLNFFFKHGTRCSYFFVVVLRSFLPWADGHPSTPFCIKLFLTLFVIQFLCVSHFNLPFDFVLFQPCHTFINSSILLPYSGFQFIFFLGQVPI
jgi:hypothetical protein